MTKTNSKKSGNSSAIKDKLILAGALLANWRMLKLPFALNLFLLKYMNQFHLRNVDGRLIIHSHLPAVNSKAYSRFVEKHLLEKTAGPSHAQIGLTNVCPQNCEYCYNKRRSGQLMNTDEIIRLIRDLKAMGVFWLGFTGGEPLMNRDLVKIVKSAGDGIALKLFTTGAGLTGELAAELKAAGLLYASVSLDHWEEAVHDRVRGLNGAFRTAVKAIRIFRQAGIHVSVSAVVSKEMIRRRSVPKLLRFLIKLGVHEAWLSEVKPVSEELWKKEAVITGAERHYLNALQDYYNKGKEITVNYLGHFESGEHFGCNAGNKMLYIDAFGEVSPCVFIPMSFGNIRKQRIQEIYADMRSHFPTESECFINQNCELLKKYSKGGIPLSREDSLKVLKEAWFSPLAEFSRLNGEK